MGHSVGFRLVALLALASLTACSTPKKERSWEEIRAERVRDFMLHLNNESLTERWREGMVEVGLKSPEDKAFVLQECKEAHDESLARGGIGTGVLRSPGRRRVMEIVSQLGDDPTGRGLLKAGLEDNDEVRMAAAAGLAEWGDEAAIPVLLQGVLNVADGDPAREAGLQALRRLAAPERRGVYLNALSEKGRRLLRPIVLKTFPGQREAKLKALREVASGHPSPYARVFALEVLVEEEDLAVVELARRALDAGDPALRPTALSALGTAGGNRVAELMEEVLRTDPEDAPDVVHGLYNVGTSEAVERAVDLLTNEELEPETRAAVARHFMGRMKEEEAPAPYRGEEALADALDGLREVIEEGNDVVTVAAVEAIGRIGERGTDVEPLLALLQDPSPKVAPAVVLALGRLGGMYAAAKLVELLAVDPQLRDHAAEALGEFSQPRDVPVDDVIDLLEDPNPKVRKAAHTALMRISSSDDSLGYDPEARESSRRKGMDRWRGWWAKRRGE